MTFSLHPRLAADTTLLCEMKLSRLLLMNDARFPWVILVPRRADMREIIDLSEEDQVKLFAEMQTVLKAMRAAFHPQKLNLGAIGNMVPQLHIHFIARFEADVAWPKPVWGFGMAEPYAPEAAAAVRAKILTGLNAISGQEN